jgi:uncharacterized protein YbbC (DUF1343 family)
VPIIVETILPGIECGFSLRRLENKKTMKTVQIGLERLLNTPNERAKIGSKRFGLVMNQASLLPTYEYACDALAVEFPNQLIAMFAPQHGLWCEQQANMIESADSRYAKLDIPVFSLYGQTREPTDAMLAGLELLLIDLQDVGTRVYTFIWTVVNCLRACKRNAIPVLLLDRPNPIGGLVIEGPRMQEDFRSFVGLADIPMRHGLTMGELAMHCNDALDIHADLQIVPMAGWQRSMHLPDCGISWCPPSPNMPRYSTALVYPGQVLLEGTSLSEGRGTTTPFEVVGAPFIDEQLLAERMNQLQLKGIHFRPIRFVPTFDKWRSQSCGGVYLHVTSPRGFRSYEATLQILLAIKQLWPDDFQWLPPPYEYEFVKQPIDILSGHSRLRQAIDQMDASGVSACIEVDEGEWSAANSEFLIY